jgi:hypothetical protein
MFRLLLSLVAAVSQPGAKPPSFEVEDVKVNQSVDVRTSGCANGGGFQRTTDGQAVETQLGLRLESRKLPTPVTVIDRVERVPVDN